MQSDKKNKVFVSYLKISNVDTRDMGYEEELKREKGINEAGKGE